MLAWVLVQGLGSRLPLAESICTLGPRGMIPGELLGHAMPGTVIAVPAVYMLGYWFLL